MIKEIKTLALLVAIIGVFVFASQASAANENLEIDYSGKPGPLFSVSNMAPNDSVQKSVTVTNNSDNDEMFAFRISQITGDTLLADVLTLTVKRFGNTLLSDKLANLKNPDEREIGIVPAYSTAVFDFIVTMDNVGNEYQGLKIKTADFIMGYSQKGQVLGEKTKGEVAGNKLISTGSNNLGLILLYTFVLISLIVLFGDKKKRKKLTKLWINKI